MESSGGAAQRPGQSGACRSPSARMVTPGWRPGRHWRRVRASWQPGRSVHDPGTKPLPQEPRTRWTRDPHWKALHFTGGNGSLGAVGPPSCTAGTRCWVSGLSLLSGVLPSEVPMGTEAAPGTACQAVRPLTPGGSLTPSFHTGGGGRRVHAAVVRIDSHGAGVWVSSPLCWLDPHGLSCLVPVGWAVMASGVGLRDICGASLRP